MSKGYYQMLTLQKHNRRLHIHPILQHHYYLAEVLVTEKGWLSNLYSKTEFHFSRQRFEVMTDQFINY